MVSSWKLLVQLHNIVGPIIMLAYPLYASVQAIESPFKEDDVQWLTYWVLYSLFQLIEIGFDRVLAWIPFWYTFKLVAICWLVLPQFHGAAFVYSNYVKKYIGGAHAGENEKLTNNQRHLIQQMSPSARASVSAFISEYGADAFDKVIASIVEAKRKLNSPSSATRHRGSPPAVQPTRYTGSSTAAQPTRYTGSSTAAQPTRYTGSATAAQPTKYTGSATAAQPFRNSGSPIGSQATRHTGSPTGPQPYRHSGSPTGVQLTRDTESPPVSPKGSSTPRSGKGGSKADSFREYCRQPVKALKTSLHSLESRRNDIRSKMGTHSTL